MRIVMGAQNCGFGPVAELTAVSRLLAGHERVFVGDGVASAFARANADAFDDIRTGGGRSAEALVESSDRVVSAMDADLAFRAVVAGRPVVMVDSLFGFWQFGRPLARIRDMCERLPRSGTFAAADAHLRELSPHERILAAHLLATDSVVQNFPGVGARLAAFAALGPGPVVHLTGPVIDHAGLPPDTAGPEPPEYDLLVNVGGFTNFLLDVEANNDYLLLLERWLGDLLRDRPQFRRVLVCGGPFAGNRARTVSFAGRQAVCCCLPQREVLRQVARTPVCLLAPGLTALHESLALGRLPLALHEQHYAHVFTVRHLDGTLFGRLANRFSDVVPYDDMPEDDHAGTAALVRIAGRIRTDDGLYAAFRRAFDERLDEHLGLTPAQQRHGVQELRDLLGGESVASVVARVFAR
ncbi:hypothetical protein GCM10010218_38110 [Streptomyces mashuensis]|uniref:Glycosyltransferase n=1 Tax=Streptomyces mashuensis TaxID=33904 RepID=A0A919B5Z6_9ACTN|nr:hypothetical protein [Streptomyces mashuensis]GHF53046.1 hypothetical protein GCM10010218_38110 [Streptomyces mashuensis]